MRTVRNNIKWMIGIDEVGRGALAGPVTVAAVMLPLDARGRAAHAPFRSLKDSKKLSAAQREFWAKELAANAGVRMAVARVYPRGIERMNISAAANRAAARVLGQLLKNNETALALGAGAAGIYLDGGLFLKSKIHQQVLAEAIATRVETVVKGDEKIPAVAAASIVAKVSRDAYMRRLAKRYPQYLFDLHKGYGTAAHRRALKKSGPCEAHRLTFLQKPYKINR